MEYTQNAINVLAARTFKGIGRAWFVKNWQPNFTDVSSVVTLINQSRKNETPISIADFEHKREIIVDSLMKSQDCMDGVVAIGDTKFPSHRGDVKNSEQPIFLFYKGDLSLLSTVSRNVAVIGLLTPTPSIEERERMVVEALVQRGATIVSGLALGCDAIAHRTTLECGGKTIAILPSPLNSIMPASNRPLAQTILEHDGLLITEYLSPAKSKMALSSRYQERDRLQALFSDGIVLSASYAKNNMGYDSGSRLAMGYASDYGIPRAVIYDQSEDINPIFDLNRQYMREDSKLVVISKDDLQSSLDVLFSLKPKRSTSVQTQRKMF